MCGHAYGMQMTWMQEGGTAATLGVGCRTCGWAVAAGLDAAEREIAGHDCGRPNIRIESAADWLDALKRREWNELAEEDQIAVARSVSSTVK